MRAEPIERIVAGARPAARADAPLLAVFGHDARESTLRKRIAAVQAEGWRVAGFTFARERLETADAEPEPIFWDDTPLGLTRDRNYLRRLPALAGALPRILERREALREATAFYARNVDMLALAAAARRLSGSRARLVYEALDVQRPFMLPGAKGAAWRAAERRLLAETDLLVVSAPEFVSRYFEGVQGYRGAWALVENKIAPAQLAAAPTAYVRGGVAPPTDGPWIVGWFGVLRCMKSLAIVDALAERLGPRVRFVLRGRLSEEDLPRGALAAVLARRDNVVFEGPYRSPEDLADVYGGVHFAWAVDYTDEGANSDWLLPNRLYEGGFFGAPAIARAGTATGRMVAENELGVALPEPLGDAAAGLLETLDREEHARARARLLGKPSRLFVDDGQVSALLRRLAETERRP